jgi:hypothetical protein
MKKFNYLTSTQDIFYKIIYPLYAKQFLLSNNYENFAKLIQESFILNSQQWEYILEHWEQKELILTND